MRRCSCSRPSCRAGRTPRSADRSWSPGADGHRPLHGPAGKRRVGGGHRLTPGQRDELVDRVAEPGARQKFQHARRLADARVEFVQVHHDGLHALQRRLAVGKHDVLGPFDVELEQIDGSCLEHVAQPEARHRLRASDDRARERADHSGVAAFTLKGHRAGRRPERDLAGLHRAGAIRPQVGVENREQGRVGFERGDPRIRIEAPEEQAREADIRAAVENARRRRRARERERALHEDVVPLRTEGQQIGVAHVEIRQRDLARREPRRDFGLLAGGAPRGLFGALENAPANRAERPDGAAGPGHTARNTTPLLK